MTEREWQRLQNSMQFVMEQQVRFEVNFDPDRGELRQSE
jgi:hypothetical protein